MLRADLIGQTRDFQRQTAYSEDKGLGQTNKVTGEVSHVTGRAYWGKSFSFKALVNECRCRLTMKCASWLAVLGIVCGLGVVAIPGAAKADSIYIGSGGVGFAIGTGGYRGGIYYGSSRHYYGRHRYYGPAYRPYRRSYYYPYYSRAYPYRSHVRINPPLHLAPRQIPAYSVVTQPGVPQRVPYTKTGLAPFTPEYTAYCARKFKSFNPHTGMYLAYSGRYRFCR